MFVEIRAAPGTIQKQRSLAGGALLAACTASGGQCIGVGACRARIQAFSVLQEKSWLAAQTLVAPAPKASQTC